MRNAFSRYLSFATLFLLSVSLGGIGGPFATAQESLGDSQPGSGASDLGGNLGAAGPAIGGGAAMADFGSLMMLIQQTIEPDSWIDQGGTSTLLPYPNGVFVDPAGMVQRRSVKPFDVKAFKNNGLSHPWRASSGLRIVSLKALDQSLAARSELGLAPSREMLQVAGLSQITAVKIDVANEDILIAGPANAGELGFMLDDLAVVAASITSHTTPLGCSIDPSNDGLRAAQAFLAQPGTSRRLAGNPKLFASQLQDKIGEHHVSFFGINPRTATALALLDADEHMKRVGFGQERTPFPMNTYFDYVERLGKAPDQSLVRWWFAYAAAERIGVNAAGNVFQLPENCVAVLSEQQFVTAAGRRATGSNDPAADAFAKSMTENLPLLRKSLPSYARLCSVFESALALQLAIEATEQTSLASWFPNLCAMGAENESTEQVVVPKSVPGLAITHKLKNGTIMAVVSGGVTMNPQTIATRGNWRTSEFLASSAVPTPPQRRTTAHEQWWWE